MKTVSVNEGGSTTTVDTTITTYESGIVDRVVDSVTKYQDGTTYETESKWTLEHGKPDVGSLSQSSSVVKDDGTSVKTVDSKTAKEDGFMV